MTENVILREMLAKVLTQNSSSNLEVAFENPASRKTFVYKSLRCRLLTDRVTVTDDQKSPKVRIKRQKIPYTDKVPLNGRNFSYLCAF